MFTFSKVGARFVEKPLQLLSTQTMAKTGTIIERYLDPNKPVGQNLVKRTIINRAVRSPLSIAGIDYFELSNEGGKKVLRAFKGKNAFPEAEGPDAIRELIEYGKRIFASNPYIPW